MNLVAINAFSDELEKIAVHLKHRMPISNKTNVEAMMEKIRTWDSPHRKEALRFATASTPKNLFELMHSMRRWYSGQTMAKVLIAQKESLGKVMKLSPNAVKGVYRGFKVDKDSPLAQLQVGQKVNLEVSRNRGLSSWSLTEAPTNKFSGGGKGKVGLIMKLISAKGVTPVLAPPEKTKPWFNELYAHVIGTSFRPKEQEYLISGPSLRVEVVRVKR